MTIDAGTGSGRALVFDVEARPIAAAHREWRLPSVPDYPGSAVFDTQTAWSLICECIREARARADVPASAIAAVTATSMREGMVLYDQDKREIWACPNIDARAREEADALVAQGLAEQIYNIAGDWTGIISPPRFLWLARHQPEIWQRTRWMSMIADWVLFRLCGEIATDPSCGSSSGLFDLRSQCWSDVLMSRLDLPPQIFPPIVTPGTTLGRLTSQAARQTGLKPGTPVVMGGADTQLALLGAGATQADCLTIVGGTFWQTAWLCDRPLIDPQRRLRTLCHVLPGLWMTEGIGFLNGLAMRWVRDTVCGAQEVRQPGEEADPYVAVERLAAGAPPGADGIFALVSDSMNARCWVQAPTCFIGVDVTNPGHTGDRGRGLLARAVQESAAFTALAHAQMLQDLSGQTATRLAFCGGASKGTLWTQIMADVCNVPVWVPQGKETTSLGAALCALVGLRLYDSLPEAAKALVGWDRVVEPNTEHVKTYEGIAQRALELQRALIGWVQAGRLPAMWRAAGAPEGSAL